MRMCVYVYSMCSILMAVADVLVQSVPRQIKHMVLLYNIMFVCYRAPSIICLLCGRE